MELLYPASFASSVVSSKDCLKRISIIVSRYCGEEAAKEFLDACDSLDHKKANDILDKTVEQLTGYDSVPMALNFFARKFPQLNPGLSDGIAAAISEREKVNIIDAYQKEIMSIIDRSCRHE